MHNLYIIIISEYQNQNLGMTIVNEEVRFLSSRLPVSLS